MMRPHGLGHTGSIVTHGAALSASVAAPAFSPTDVANLIGWYDAQEVSTVTLDGSEVTSLANRVVGGLPIVKDPSTGGPEYVAEHPVANEHPALVWPNSANGLGLFLGVDASVRHVFMVAAYRTGVETTFDKKMTFFADLQGMENYSGVRIMGDDGTDHLLNQAGHGVLASKGDDDLTASTTILPLPLDVVHFSEASNFNLTAIGSKNSNSTSRAWQGCIGEVLAYSDDITLEETQQIKDYLKAKWGINNA